MFGFGQLIEVLKKSPKKIVFTEGSDPRILEASSRLLASNFLHPIHTVKFLWINDLCPTDIKSALLCCLFDFIRIAYKDWM